MAMSNRMSSSGLTASSGNINYNSAPRHSQNQHYSSEALESQLRKLQVENSTLQTENKLLKEKYNRSTVKITELESRLADLQDELVSVQENLSKELQDVKTKSQAESDWNTKQLHARIATLTKSNESLKLEVVHLEKQLESVRKELELAKTESSKSCEGHKIEISGLKEEVEHLKELLNQDEQHLQDEAAKTKEARQQVMKLNEMILLLQQQADAGGSNTAAQKQVMSLERRLQITEERLHQEHADRANNLSKVEEKLLSENAKLQAAEKELIRQLQREKDKNHNLDMRIRDLKEDNEKLRLSVPLDENLITVDSNTDIHQGNRNTQKNEKVSDLKYIMSQIKDKAGLSYGDEKEIICHLWNEKEKVLRKLCELEMHLQDLGLPDNAILQELKELLDFKGKYESKISEMQEKIDDIQSEKMTFENQYHSQLSALVKEKHEACARLKTLEDMMDAIRTENDILRQGLSSSPSSPGARFFSNREPPEQIAKLTSLVKNLENKTGLLERQTKLLLIETDSVKSQLAAKEKQLEEVKANLTTANRKLEESKADNYKQEKIDKLAAEVTSLQNELKLMTEKCQDLMEEKSTLTQQLEETAHQLSLNKNKQKEIKLSHTSESKFSTLEMELDEKDKQLVKMTSQYHQIECELQHNKEELFYSQEQISELEREVESLQKQISQRSELYANVTAKEIEHLLQQVNVLKNLLQSSEKKFNSTRSELKIFKVKLTENEHKLKMIANQTDGNDWSGLTGDKNQHATEEEQADSEILETLSTMKFVEEERDSLREAMSKVKQDLLAEQSIVLRLSADKVEAEQKLQELSLEYDALRREKSQTDEDVVKLERTLQEVLHKFEDNARNQHSGFKSSHSAETPEVKKIVSELNSLRLLVMSKDKELEMMADKLNRPNAEINYLRRRVDLLRSETQYNKEDIHRLTNELILKMKENSALIETNSLLLKEKSTLERENKRLQKELQQEKNFHQKKKVESADFIKKVEHAEQTVKVSTEELQEKKNQIASLETELQHVKRQVSQMEAENEQLKNKVKHLNDDIKNLTDINSSLESRLEMERSSLAEERMNASQKKEDLTATGYRLEALKHEQSMLLNNLSAERQTTDQLRLEVNRKEQMVQKLTQDLKGSEQEIETLHGQIDSLKEKIEQIKVEKTYLYQDYEAMCRKHNEKEQAMTELKQSYEEKIENLKKEVVLEQSEGEQDKKSLENSLKHAKEEIADLNEELKKKEIQLSSYSHALQELHELSMHKKETESKLERMETKLSESQIILESHRNEIMSYRESNKKLQDELGESQARCQTLQQELNGLKERSHCQTLEYTHKITDIQTDKDAEISRLKDALSQAELKLQSTQEKLEEIRSKYEQLLAEYRTVKKSLDQIKSLYSEECTARKYAEQKVLSSVSETEEVRRDKSKCEERILELQTKLGIVETQLKSESDRVNTLSSELQECHMSSGSMKKTLRTQQEKINILQSEVGKLQGTITTEKNLFEISSQRSTLELRQKIDMLKEDRQKMAQQINCLSASLERAREQLTAKNVENLKLNTELVDLNDKLEENSKKLQQAKDALRIEEEMQVKLNARFEEQELELKNLKEFLAKKCNKESKEMWQEMEKTVQELSNKMQQQLENQKTVEEKAKERESTVSKKYQKQISRLESEITTERALHSITKNSLHSLEEDTARLRSEIMALRLNSPSPSKNDKCRTEAINELIAKAELRAEQMTSFCCPGGHLSFNNLNLNHSCSPSLDDLHTPDSMSQVSDQSFNAKSPLYIAMLNASGTFQNERSSTPRN